MGARHDRPPDRHKQRNKARHLLRQTAPGLDSKHRRDETDPAIFLLMENDMTDTYSVTADELQRFIDAIELLDAEIKDRTEDKKEVFAEAKGRGYDAAVMRKVLARRKREPDDLAEEEAVLETYETALNGGGS